MVFNLNEHDERRNLFMLYYLCSIALISIGGEQDPRLIFYIVSLANLQVSY